MTRSHALAAVLSLAALILPAWPQEADQAALPAVSPSDTLAADLERLSDAFRRRDLSSIAAFLDDGLVADGLPSVPGSLRREEKWISSHGWGLAGPAEVIIGGRKEKQREDEIVLRTVDKAELLLQVEAFLGHFWGLEDARLVATRTNFPGPPGGEATALVAFEAVGRDEAGRREWARGIFDLALRRAGERWRITRWHTGALDSLLSNRDLFSEVTVPAGVDHRFPRFGVPPNDGFLAQGGAVGDADGDGLMDLLLTEVDGARLYINDGQGGFRDVSQSVHLRDLPRRPTGAAFLDYDQDGDSDIFLSAVGEQMLLESRVDRDGIRRFHDVSRRARVNVPAVGFSVAVADVNLDGLPDVYVTSYNRFGSVMPGSWTRATNGTPNLLFVNVGSGRFRELARDWGVNDGRWSSAAAFADANGDGWQDLYVVNDFGENALYVNKRMRFSDEAGRRGVALPGGGTAVAWGDYDNDGDLDLQVAAPGHGASGAAPGIAMFMNRGNGWFTDVTARTGAAGAGWAFGGGFIDFDNDGLEDLFSAAGFVSGPRPGDAAGFLSRHVAASEARTEAAGNESFRSALMDRIFSGGLSLAGHQRDGLFLATGDGRFRDISGASGVDSPSDGRGAIFADFDNDGDYDILTTAAQGAARHLYRNNVGQDGNFLRVTLKGTRSGPDAFGAVVRLKTSRGIQTKVKSAGSGFLSVHDPRLLFGLGEDERAEWLEVTWPSGLKQRAEGIQARDSLKITEGSEVTERVDEVRFRLPDPPGESERAFGALKVVRGKGLPSIPVLSTDGVEGTVRDRLTAGRRTLLYFWATWCAPCRAEMAALQDLHPDLAAAGVDLLAVSLDAGGTERVRAFLDRGGITFPVVVAADGSAHERLVRGDDPALPFTLVLDERGAVTEAFLGWSPRARETFRLLAGGS